MARGPLAAGFDRRFVAVVGGFTIVALALYREEVLGGPLAPLAAATARVAFALLQATGADAVRSATVIFQPSGFAYDINYSCTGILPAAFLVVSILAYPAAGRVRLAGLAVTVPAILALNQVRLVHLFYVGTRRPEIFDVVHLVVWEWAIIAAVFALWAAWTRWADGRSAVAARPGAAVGDPLLSSHGAARIG